MSDGEVRDLTWRQLDSGRLGGLPLDLYERSGEFIIRVGGFELMNSLCHESEDALASIAKECTEIGSTPRVLIGGLGLGYTLAAFLRIFSTRIDLAVVETSTDILRWYREHFKAKAVRDLDDSTVRFIEGDVADEVFARESFYDLIVLDVDNGPEPICGEGNRRLYGKEGLARTQRCLRSGGKLLLWSAFASPAFEAAAREAGFFSVQREEVPLSRMRHPHFVYICSSRSLAKSKDRMRRGSAARSRARTSGGSA